MTLLPKWVMVILVELMDGDTT